MYFALTRKPLDVYVRDADAVRSWLMDRIREEVKLVGAPHPKIILAADGYQEVLDLDRMAKGDRGADAGATFQALRARPGIERRFVLMGFETDDATGATQHYALLFEEIDDNEGRRWWCATLPYERDPASGIGRPALDWNTAYGETAVAERLLPCLQALAFPVAGGRAANVLPPRAEPPDIQVAMGEVPEGLTLRGAPGRWSSSRPTSRSTSC